jgi:signal transduction histidine kinase
VGELERAAGRDDRLDALMSMLSHELRSPLQSLMLNVEVCLQRLHGGPDPSAEWFIEKMSRQRRLAGRLKLLIDTFLDIGQMASGELRLEPETLDLGELVSDVVRRASDDLTWARCQCDLEVTPGVTGRWDRVQIDLVVSNLLSNAIKYGGGFPIAVTVTGTAEAGLVRIQDHGAGIAPADHARVFEKFTRLPGPSVVGGFGLGLWIVRKVVEAAGGSILLESDVGQGATFTISLPRQGPPIRR